MSKDQEIINAFSNEKEVVNDVLLNFENLDVKKEDEALDRIGKYVAPGQVIDYRLRRAQEVIDAFLLPHIGQGKEHRIAKAYYLCMMAEKAIERAYNLRGEDDKDHYANKRLELSGKLMEHLFRYSFKYFIKDLKFNILFSCISFYQRSSATTVLEQLNATIYCPGDELGNLLAHLIVFQHSHY